MILTLNNFKFDENGGQFSKRVENTVGKGEIAFFSVSHSVFERLILQAQALSGWLSGVYDS